MGPEDQLAGISNLKYSRIAKETDARGKFTLTGLVPDTSSISISAMHDDYTEEYVAVDPRAGEQIEIRLKKGHCIYGKVYDNDGSPIPGIMVVTYENGFPIHRPVLTGSDGSYRTCQLHSGHIVVAAKAVVGNENWWEVEDALNFTRERKSVEITDNDVELDFWSQPDLASLNGIVYDETGQPVPGAFVFVYPVDRTLPFGRPLLSATRCDSFGVFELIRLVPGEYETYLAVTQSEPEIHAGNIILPGPGPQEGNFKIPNGEINGIVLRQGIPVSKCRIGARNRGVCLDISSYTNESGEFFLKGLLPGTYSIDVSPNLRSSLCYSLLDSNGATAFFEIFENTKIENISFPIPTEGTLLLKGEGYNLFDLDKITYAMTCSAPMDPHKLGPNEINYGFRIDGSLEYRSWLPTGHWVMTLTYGEEGSPLVREFDIIDGQETVVTANRDEL